MHEYMKILKGEKKKKPEPSKPVANGEEPKDQNKDQANLQNGMVAGAPAGQPGF